MLLIIEFGCDSLREYLDSPTNLKQQYDIDILVGINKKYENFIRCILVHIQHSII